MLRLVLVLRRVISGQLAGGRGAEARGIARVILRLLFVVVVVVEEVWREDFGTGGV